MVVNVLVVWRSFSLDWSLEWYLSAVRDDVGIVVLRAPSEIYAYCTGGPIYLRRVAIHSHLPSSYLKAPEMFGEMAPICGSDQRPRFLRSSPTRHLCASRLLRHWDILISGYMAIVEGPNNLQTEFAVPM